MKITAFDPDNRKLRQKFIQLPFDLYQDDPNWVPPLMMDMRLIFNRKRHGFYQHGDARFLLATHKGNTIGRLAILDNHGLQAAPSQRIGHFFFFEAKNDPMIATSLFDQGISWAQKQGLNKLYGPKGMTPLDGLGLLVRGFELRPAFGMPYNPPYYPQFFSAYGFEKVREIESGYINQKKFHLPAKVQKAARLIQERKGFHVLQLRSRKDLRNAVQLLGEMYNAALSGTEGNVPLSDSDLKTIIQGLLWIAKPELIKLIIKEDQPIGFMLAYPDISAAIRKTGGRLLPFGWIRCLCEKYHTSWININGIGIADEYRGLAGTALLFSELYKSVSSSGQFKHAEVIQIGEDNDRMRRELEGMGINFYKSHAMYELDI